MMKRNKKKENYLDRVPAVAADLDWEVEDDTVIVHQKNKGFYARIAQKFFSSPEKFTDMTGIYPYPDLTSALRRSFR